MTPTFTTGTELFGLWLADVERGEPPVRYIVPEPFGGLDIRPGRLLLFGGAPGGGKTAALLQIGIDILRMNPTARLLVANVEMEPPQLLDRIVSRLSSVPLTTIADRALSADQLSLIQGAVKSIESAIGRLAFLRPPFSLEHVAAAASGDAFDANVMILDYIQRFTVGDNPKDQREQMDTAATVLRRFCGMGAAMLVASAMARQKGEHGSTYKGLSLASFRGSSELEYGTDAAYILSPAEGGLVQFQCEKNRYGAVADIFALFNAATQTYTVAPSGLAGFDAAIPSVRDAHQAKGVTHGNMPGLQNPV